MTAKVLNLKTLPHDYDRSNAVYIGRPSDFGNPFKAGLNGTQKQVVKMFREWLKNRPALQKKALQELKGRDLLCFCKPKPCHGDVLLELLENGELK